MNKPLAGLVAGFDKKLLCVDTSFTANKWGLSEEEATCYGPNAYKTKQGKLYTIQKVIIILHNNLSLFTSADRAYINELQCRMIDIALNVCAVDFSTTEITRAHGLFGELLEFREDLQ